MLGGEPQGVVVILIRRGDPIAIQFIEWELTAIQFNLTFEI